MDSKELERKRARALKRLEAAERTVRALEERLEVAKREAAEAALAHGELRGPPVPLEDLNARAREIHKSTKGEQPTLPRRRPARRQSQLGRVRRG